MEDNEITLEQYKLIFSSTETIFKTRAIVNNYFLMAYGTLLGFYINLPNTPLSINIFAFLFSLIITIYWVCVLQNYNKINTAKFKALEELEKKLPEQIFTNEYKCSKKRGKIDLSKIEMTIPILLFIITLFYALPEIFDKIC